MQITVRTLAMLVAAVVEVEVVDVEDTSHRHRRRARRRREGPASVRTPRLALNTVIENR